MINKYYSLSKDFYKKAVVIDICTLPNKYSLCILLHFAYQSLRYYLLYLFSNFTDVTNLENMSVSELLKSKYVSCIDKDISRFLSSADLFILYTMQNDTGIDSYTIDIKDEIMSWLHHRMQANNICSFDPNEHSMLLGAVYHNNSISYDGIILRKVVE